MTSGVKQTLPQILMPKPGIEGKTVRSRAPQGDFAETLGLGKASAQTRGEAKAAFRDAARGELDVRAPVWPRLASRLDGAAEGARTAAPEGYAPDPLSEAGGEDGELGHYPAARGDATVAETPLPAEPRDADIVPPSIRAAEPVPSTARDMASETMQAPVEPARVIARPADAPTPQTMSRQAMPKAEKSTGVGGDGAIRVFSGAVEPGVATPTPSFTPVGRGAQPGSVRFEAALRPADSGDKPSVDRPAETAPEMPSEPARAAPRVTVLAQQNIPAPPPSTALVLVDSIAASDLLGASAARLSPEAIHASVTHGSARSLKIQLHPAELGTVTATLRFAGEQLSIELQVENQEAHRRLTGDSETIVRALRDLGYAVDSVTVLQPSIAHTPAGRADTAASMASPQTRAADAFASGPGNGGGANSGGRSPGEGGNAGQGSQHNASPRKQNAGGGLYI